MRDVLLALTGAGLLSGAVAAVLLRAGWRRARRALAPVRVRALGYQAVMNPTVQPRALLAQDVLRARQAFDLAQRDGRELSQLAPTLKGLERVARSLDAQLKARPGSAGEEVARSRDAAQALVIACRATPGRAALLDEVCDAAERARLTAQAHRDLTCP